MLNGSIEIKDGPSPSGIKNYHHPPRNSAVATTEHSKQHSVLSRVLVTTGFAGEHSKLKQILAHDGPTLVQMLITWIIPGGGLVP